MSECLYVRGVYPVSDVRSDESGAGTLLGLAFLAGALVVGLAGATIAALSQALKEWRNTREEAAREGGSIPLLPEARQTGRKLAISAASQARGLAPLERRKVQALAEVAPYVVRTEEVEPHVLQVVRASTPTQLDEAARSLRLAVQSSHNRVVTGALAAACKAASIRVGFPSVRVQNWDACQVRVIAEDPAGRALVTEIQLVHGQPRLMAEVVGMADPRCHALMDAYTRALEEAGARLLHPPLRKPTLGVPQLQASRDYVRRRVDSPRGQTRRAARQAHAVQLSR